MFLALFSYKIFTSTNRFVFSASKIAALRDKFSDNSFGEFPRRPTRIEALSAFIWARCMTAIKAQDEPNKIYSLLHAVNLRPRSDPPLPDQFFGNFSRPAIVVPSMDGEINCQAIISQVRIYIKTCTKNTKKNTHKKNEIIYVIVVYFFFFFGIIFWPPQ